eukprot:gene4540-5656_t
MELLKTLKANSPVFPNDLSRILYVKKNDPIENGFKTLIDNNILSAPVYDENEKRYCCFFSFTDLIHEVLEATSTIFLPQGDITTVMNILIEKDLFKKHRVGDIANISKRDPFIVIDSDKRLDEVARLIVNNRLRRVAVIDQRGELCNIITISRIIECISHLFEMDRELGVLGEKKIRDIKIGSGDVITIQSNEKALEAFRLIARMGISGIGVVDSQKKIVGVISEHDLNIIKSHCQYLSLLYLPISEYLEALQKICGQPRSTITCKKTDSFKDVVQKITENKIHRIFVVDDDNRLEGIISLVDILEQVVIHSLSTISK